MVKMVLLETPEQREVLEAQESLVQLELPEQKDNK